MRHLLDILRWILSPYRRLIWRLFVKPDVTSHHMKSMIMEGLEKDQAEIERELRVLQAAVSVYQRRPYQPHPRAHGGH